MLVLVIGILIIGTVNTIVSKLQDKVCIDNCESTSPVYFEQPLIQTLNMFIGESLCLIVWYFGKSRVIDQEEQEPFNGIILKKPRYWMLLFPTLCDLISSTCMNFALILVAPSIFQTLRGSLIIFTAIISMIFLRKRYTIYQSISLFIIFAGISVVGISNIINSNGNGNDNDNVKEDNTANLIGICIILLAQIFTATQYVIEEKIMQDKRISPLLAVGLEGLIGTILLLLISPIYFIVRKINVTVLFWQIIHEKQLLVSFLVLTFTIAILNYLGLSLTMNMSSTARTTIDACRILIVWIVSLIIGWEIFNLIQLLGFLIMVSGIYIYFTSPNVQTQLQLQPQPQPDLVNNN
jgi:drug/metabolite transporter (DMT)-like permease